MLIIIDSLLLSGLTKCYREWGTPGNIFWGLIINTWLGVSRVYYYEGSYFILFYFQVQAHDYVCLFLPLGVALRRAVGWLLCCRAYMAGGHATFFWKNCRWRSFLISAGLVSSSCPSVIAPKCMLTGARLSVKFCLD